MDLSDAKQIEAVIKRHCVNNCLSLNTESFKNLLCDLLSDSDGKSHELPELDVQKWFTYFDVNEDGVIDEAELECFSNVLIRPLIKPVTALLVIDVQNDFIDGSLALRNCPAKQDGKDVIPVINNLLNKYPFDVVAYTHDHHPQDHISFFDNVKLHGLSDKNKELEKISLFDTVIFEGPPEMNQKLWPVHCVQNTSGCKLHKDLKITEDSIDIFKGTNSFVDSYSAFFDNMKLSKTELDQELKKKNVTHVFICGLAFDYCVSFTAIDSVELGYATVVIKDASKGTDISNIKNMEEKLKSLNCVLANSCEIEDLIKGKDIRVEFVSALLSTIKKS